jgi:hypothetical protein
MGAPISVSGQLDATINGTDEFFRQRLGDVKRCTTRRHRADRATTSTGRIFSGAEAETYGVINRAARLAALPERAAQLLLTTDVTRI